MQELAKLLGKSITRYILPGMVFYLLIVLLPTKIFFPDLSSTINITEKSIILTIVVVMGYLLDAIGAYRYTLCFRDYKREKINLANELRSISSIEINSGDPDKYIAQIWFKNNESYDNIMDERSEWVMILISSFILLLVIPQYVIFYFLSSNLSLFVLGLICAICLLLSYMSAKTGIKRMKAHDQKMIYCLTELNNKN